jgi:hypothetical protein
MEKLRRIQQEEFAPELPLPRHSEGAEGPGTPAAAAGVRITWGPTVDDMAVQGMTVQAVYQLLQAPFNIAPQVAALVDGRTVDGNHRLAAGEALEFIRHAAEKG